MGDKSDYLSNLEVEMSVAESLLPELVNEMATTRSLLERVPAEHTAWKPHPRSYSLGDLAMHVATLPGLGAMILEQEEVDVDPDTPLIPPFTTAEALLEAFDSAVSDLRAALERTTAEALQVVWSLKAGGKTFISLPRAAAYRTVFLNHLIHHRGQLSVYLRLRDVPLPPIYGPTADTEAAQATGAIAD